MTDLASLLAEHVVSFPAHRVAADVRQHLALDLADSLAATLGGSRAAGIAELGEILQQQFRPGQARVFNSSLKLPAVAAAQLNASAGHALDFDDTLDEGGGMHAGALVHNAALAVADELGEVSGADYATAVALGLDVAVRLALAPSEDFGWHRTSAFGVFGVVAAVGRLLRLDAAQLLNAFGIAYSQASGNRQCIADGALSNRLQAGFAARDGISAVLLARAGLTGAQRVFEGVDGFFNLYQRGAWRRAAVVDGLGEELLSTRIALKPYPCGRNLHALIDASLAARARHGGRTVEAVDVLLDARSLARASSAYPQHVVEAQFSIPFSLALSTLSGATRLADYAAPLQADAAIQRLAARVRLQARDSAAASDLLRFRYADGTTLEQPIEAIAHGNPARPLSAAQVAEKLRDANRFAGAPLDDARLDALLHNALNFAALPSTQELTRLLQP